jgi:hypothetical protein
MRLATPRAEVPLLRYYARGAGALAQRNALVTVAAVILALALVPEAPAFLRQVALALAAREAPRAPALLVAAVALGIAAKSAATLRLGLGGWIRSLPLDGRQHRRAMAVALLVPLAPVLAAEGLALSLTPTLLDEPAGLAPLLGCGIGALAAGAAAIPVRRGAVARPLALAAALLSTRGGAAAIGASFVLLLAWDVTAGAVELPRRAGERRRLADRWIPVLLTWRALRFRMLGSLVPAALLLWAAWLYRVNNGLSVAQAGFVTRLATLGSLVLGLAALGDGLVVRRRPWSWARSLPATAAGRVVEDALAISAPAVATLAVATWLDWRAGALGLASLPTLALLAAGAVRRAGGKLYRASGQVLWSGGTLVALVAVWPIAAALALAVSPALVALAARAEKRLVVTGWEPLHHGAEGDPLSGATR